MNRITNAKTGDCDCCPDSKNVTLTLRHGDWMCDNCVKLETDAESRQTAIDTIEKSHAIDETIQIQSDIFNAATVSFAELKASIDNASDASQADKDYALYLEAVNRIKQMTAGIVADEQALVAKKNGRHAWVTQVQELTVNLRADYRAKAKAHDLSYQPTTPKSVKPAKTPKTPTNTFTSKAKGELNDAAEKYKVPAHMVRITMVQFGISAENAARRCAVNLGLITE